MKTSSGNHFLVLSASSLPALLAAIVIATTSACSRGQSHDSTTHDANTVVTETTRIPLGDLQAAASAGKPLYAIHCAACHGDAGKADGIASDSLPAKPTDLTAGETVSSPDGKLFLVIKNGKMKDGKFTMAPVKKLTDEQIWQVVAYVRTLGQQ
jgi:cytochrome c